MGTGATRVEVNRITGSIEGLTSAPSHEGGLGVHFTRRRATRERLEQGEGLRIVLTVEGGPGTLVCIVVLQLGGQVRGAELLQGLEATRIVTSTKRELGQGKTVQDILNSRSAVTEGVMTTKAVHELAQKLGLEMPITAAVYAVVHDNKPLEDTIDLLLARPYKKETQ